MAYEQDLMRELEPALQLIEAAARRGGPLTITIHVHHGGYTEHVDLETNFAANTTLTDGIRDIATVIDERLAEKGEKE